MAGVLYLCQTDDDDAMGLSFLTPHISQDRTLLRDQSAGFKLFDQFDSLEPSEINLSLVDYMSYDDMQISALIGLSGPQYFINSGSRNSYDDDGFLIGC